MPTLVALLLVLAKAVLILLPKITDFTRTMEDIRIPTFVAKEEKLLIMSRLQTFTAIVKTLTTERQEGIDITVPIMKTLANLKPIPGLSYLNGMFDTLKDLVFHFHLTAGDTKKMASLDLSGAKDNIFPQELSENLRKILHLQGLLKKEHKKHVDTFEQYALELYRLETKLDDTEVVQKIYASRRATMLEREQVLKDQLKTLSVQLAYLTEKRIRKVIQDAKDQLMKVAQNSLATNEIVETIKSIKPGTTAHQIYLEASEVYSFPSKPQDLIYCPISRHCTIPTDVHSHTCGKTIVNTCQEINDLCLPQLYMRAVEKYNVNSGRGLKLKKGQVVKSKMVSSDGTSAFGWKKTQLGMKVWGFFPTTVVT